MKITTACFLIGLQCSMAARLNQRLAELDMADLDSLIDKYDNKYTEGSKPEAKAETDEANDDNLDVQISDLISSTGASASDEHRASDFKSLFQKYSTQELGDDGLSTGRSTISFADCRKLSFEVLKTKK